MAGSGSADDIIKAALKALGESRAGGKIDEIAGGAENALRDIITNLVNQAKGAAGVKPPKPPKPPKAPKVPVTATATIQTTEEMLKLGKSAYERGTQKGLGSLSPEEMYYAMHYAESSKLPQLHTKSPVVPAETALKPSQIRRAENQAAWAADKERRRLALIESGEDRASIKIRNRAEHAASQEAKYGKGKGSNRATERDNVDIPKAPKGPKAPKTPKVEEVKPTRTRSANSRRLEAENELKDLRAMKAEGTLDQNEFAEGLKDAQKNGAKLTKKEQEMVTLNEYDNGPNDWNDGSK